MSKSEAGADRRPGVLEGITITPDFWGVVEREVIEKSKKLKEVPLEILMIGANGKLAEKILKSSQKLKKLWIVEGYQRRVDATAKMLEKFGEKAEVFRGIYPDAWVKRVETKPSLILGSYLLRNVPQKDQLPLVESAINDVDDGGSVCMSVYPTDGKIVKSLNEVGLQFRRVPIPSMFHAMGDVLVFDKVN